MFPQKGDVHIVQKGQHKMDNSKVSYAIVIALEVTINGMEFPNLASPDIVDMAWPILSLHIIDLVLSNPSM